MSHVWRSTPSSNGTFPPSISSGIPLACRGFVGFYRAYFSPSFAMIGLCGNMLVIWFNVKDSKRSRFTIYCISLAISHSLILLFNSVLDDFLGRGLCYALRTNHIIKLDTMSDVSCKFMEYIPNSMYTWSSWTLLIFSVDRLITVYSPINYFSTKFISTTVILCILIAFSSLMIHIPVLITYQLIERPRMGVVDNWKCDAPQNNAILTDIFLNMKIFLTFTIPTVLILLLNVAICVVFWRQLRRRQQLVAMDLYHNRREMNRVVGHLALTWTFLLFNVPLVVVMFMRHYSTKLGQQKPSNRTSLEDLSRLFSSVKDITYAADFFLYVLFLRSFRRRFLKSTVEPLLKLACVSESCCGHWVKENMSFLSKSGLVEHHSYVAAHRVVKKSCVETQRRSG